MQSLEKEQSLTTEWLKTHHMNRILYETERRFGKSQNDPEIDKSIELGYRGWVACSPEPGEERLWLSHEFSRVSEGKFRRMGYFAGV